MRQIYLDNAATTQPSPEVIKAMDEVNEKYWGNPSSIHSVGQEANRVLHEAREKVADFLNCDFQEVIFTSGGSESDNLAIRGIINAIIARNEMTKQSVLDRSPRFARDDKEGKPHIITSMTEHHAVLHTIQELEKEGKIEATYLKPDKNGVISAKSVRDAIKDNTILVSIMYVNNETGVINPIKEIGEIVKVENITRGFVISTPFDELRVNSAEKSFNKKDKISPPISSSRDDRRLGRIFFHTDAVQAAEWLPMDVNELGVDLLTLTAHKIHGPKGIGVLYVRKGVPIKPEISGGGQEFNKRAGTENVPSIAGLAAAIEECKSQISNLKIVEELRDKLVNGLLKKISNSRLNGAGAPRAPHIANVSFINAEGEAIILNLDFLGIAVSSGSACTSKSLEPSHVLTAMGIAPEVAHGSIRFSLSRYTEGEEIDKVIEVLPGIIKKLRAMSPFK